MNEELNRLWEEHVKDLTSRGIKITFKPAKYLTDEEREELNSRIGPWDKPTWREVNE